jgi:ATP phosphoribosyltransferase regulatory subunit
MNRWLLPENIADILPSEARKIEELRRLLLDCCQGFGYELVMPPLLEYIDSLLTGTGHDLNLKTFKLVDQLSGRTLGLRADITPQVARIDAHLLNREGVTRLCYAGSVLHTRAAPGAVSREQLQLGAEIYGHAGWEADLEIQALLIQVLKLAQVGRVTLDMGHAGVLSGILGSFKPEAEDLDALYAHLQAKDRVALQAQIVSWPKEVQQGLLTLLDLSGTPANVMALVKKAFPGNSAVMAALADLDRLRVALEALGDSLQLNWDLSDLRGYQYHSGVMFAAYVDGLPGAVARGGRYDRVGAAFGRSRPATGFSLDIMTLSRISKIDSRKKAILAPWSNDQKLAQMVATLRSQGEVVIQLLPGHEQDGDEFSCDRQLVQQSGGWVLQSKA